MMKFFLLAAAMLCIVSLSAQRKVTLATETQKDSILASVNGESITLQDVILESSPEESKLASLFQGEDLYLKIMEVRRNILENLVNRKLVYAAYKKQPFEIPSQNIEDMVDSLARIMGDGTRESLERRLKSLGSDMNKLKEKAREKIATDVLIYRNCHLHVRITPKEIYEEYEAKSKQWKKLEQLELQLCQVLKKKRADGTDPVKVVENLKNMFKNADEEMFAEIVMKNTTGPNAAKGGRMGWIERNKLRPEFIKPLQNAKKGDIAGPIETTEGYYFIRVCNIVKEETIPFEKAASVIEKELKEKAIRERREKYFKQLREGAVIRILI